MLLIYLGIPWPSQLTAQTATIFPLVAAGFFIIKKECLVVFGTSMIYIQTIADIISRKQQENVGQPTGE